MKLQDTDQSLEVYLGAAHTTNALHITVGWEDENTSADTIAQHNNTLVTNGTTAVVMLTAPASGHTLELRYASIYNADTSYQDVYVREVDGSDNRIVVKKTLAPGETLSYASPRGWL